MGSAGQGLQSLGLGGARGAAFARLYVDVGTGGDFDDGLRAHSHHTATLEAAGVQDDRGGSEILFDLGDGLGDGSSLESFDVHSITDSHDAYGFNIDALDDFVVRQHGDRRQRRLDQLAHMVADLRRAEDHAAGALLHEFADAGRDGLGDLAGELRRQREERAASLRST